jgi:hypothetical protein
VTNGDGRSGQTRDRGARRRTERLDEPQLMPENCTGGAASQPGHWQQ